MASGPAPLLECVPNVSEGRDAALVRALADAVRTGGAELRDVHSDPDHHRSVLTFLGASPAVERAALALAETAVARIDLTRHHGVHPRVGAVDVVPFVPLRGARMADAVGAAHRVGRALAAACGVPVIFYGEAATRPHCRALPALRRGGLAGLGERLREAAWCPDAGPARPHPTAGVTAVGARGPLVAFNAVVDGGDLALAAALARELRESSGGLRGVQALGLPLASRGLAQVSMNLLDLREAPPREVAERLEALARARGARVREYELVGCASADLFAGWPDTLAPLAGLKPSQLLDPSLFADPSRLDDPPPSADPSRSGLPA